MKPGMTDGSFYVKDSSDSSKAKATGPQGSGGEMAGQAVGGVNNPRGIEPKKLGSYRMPLSQGPREPKVGK